VAYVPFAVPVAFGDKNDCRQLRVTLKWGQQVIVKNDTSQPTVAGPNTNVLYVGVKIIFFGQYCAKPSDSACNLPMTQAVPPASNNPGARAW